MARRRSRLPGRSVQIRANSIGFPLSGMSDITLRPSPFKPPSPSNRPPGLCIVRRKDTLRGRQHAAAADRPQPAPLRQSGTIPAHIRPGAARPGGAWPGLTLTGFVWGLFFAPADWQQGDAVRIMYVHVPVRLAGLVRLLVAGHLLACCRWSGGIRSPTWRRPRSGRWARPSPRSAWPPAASGASRCGAPGGCGTRG